VAPYEADAQLAFLDRSNMLDCVISDDSDLLAHGVRTILRTPEQGKAKALSVNNVLSALDLDLSHFRTACVLCGCD
jgi:exonuclease-1